MKKFILMVFVLLLCFSISYAQPPKSKLIILISEQNIAGPQRAWWASEVDLSLTEATISQRLLEQGYIVVEPKDVGNVLAKEKAFKVVDLSEAKSVQLGNLSKADYVVTGKAIASSAGNVPQSNLRSCFANITAKVIRVKDGKVIAYLDATGNSAHLDVITGGKEALVNAAGELAGKLIEALTKQEGGGN